MLSMKQATVAFATAALCIGMSAANASFIQLSDPSAMTGSITTLTFDTGASSVNGPGMTFEAGSFKVSTSYSTMHSGRFGLAESFPGTDGPDNQASFTSGVYQVGMFFGNDDTCCSSGYSATLSAYDINNALIGSVAVVANMNDTADQFIGIQSDTLIYQTVLSYGDANATLFGVVDDFAYGGNALVAHDNRVPEPAEMALLGMGLLGLSATRKLNRQK